MDLVVKGNELTEAAYTLGLSEQRVLILAVIQAREKGITIDSNTMLEVKASTYAEKFGVTKWTAYEALNDAVNTLWKRQATLHLTYKGHPSRMLVRWVTAAQYVDDLALVRIRFSPELLPMIGIIEQNFTKYELAQISGLQTAYSVRLYELMIQWRSNCLPPPIELAELRERLGVTSIEYPRMDNFKRRVLEPAIAQVNKHTDITVSYEQIKSGRTITHLKFKFKFKEPQRFIPPTNEQIDKMKGLPLGETYDQVRARLKREWMAKNSTN